MKWLSSSTFPWMGGLPSNWHPALKFANTNYTRALVLGGTVKVRVHMNVVPRSTMNSNDGTENYRYSADWLFMGSISTLIYTSELILCSIVWVHSATRHNIHIYPYFLFAAIHNLKSFPTFSVRPCSSVGRVTVDLIRRSWVRFPPRSKDFFFTSCGSLIPFTRANAQWVIHRFN